MGKNLLLESFLDKLSKKLELSQNKNEYDECVLMVEEYKNNLNDDVVKNRVVKSSLNDFLDLLIKQINNEPVELASEEGRSISKLKINIF